MKTASDAVLTGYERPSDQGDAVKEKRAGYGQTYFDKYAGTKTEKPAGTCTAAKVIAVAVDQIGYKEKASNTSLDSKTANAGSANYTKYARDFDQKYPKWYNGKKNGFAWCDMFVDWCFLTAFGYDKALAASRSVLQARDAPTLYATSRTRASSIPRTRSREIRSSSVLRSTIARTPGSWNP